MKNTDTIQQTQEDRDILKVVGHPKGPRFNGPDHVECRNYDEHRWDFRRVGSRWVCDTCDEDR